MEAMIYIFQGLMLLLLYLTVIIRATFIYFNDQINPFSIGKAKNIFNMFLEYAFITGLLVWSYEIMAIVFNYNFHIIPFNFWYNLLLDNIILKYTGMLFMLVGYLIFIFSLFSFGKSWRIGIDNDKPGNLVTTGMFSITRNPLFIFLDLYFIGTALINTNLFFIFIGIIFIAGIHYQILQEEIFLQKHYGKEYAEYKKRVRRYI